MLRKQNDGWTKSEERMMNDPSSLWNRLSVIAKLAELAEKIPKKKLGRAAIMKYLYFLQILCKVPLGYDFRLHTYGPFQPDVLDDLSYAESLQVVTSKTVTYPTGYYGYEISCADAAEKVNELGSDFLDKYQDDIDWVMSEFGDYSAAELGMISTIIYVDRELSQRDNPVSLHDLAQRVHNIKPHINISEIRSMAQSLQAGGLLEATSSS